MISAQSQIYRKTSKVKFHMSHHDIKGTQRRWRLYSPRSILQMYRRSWEQLMLFHLPCAGLPSQCIISTHISSSAFGSPAFQFVKTTGDPSIHSNVVPPLFSEFSPIQLSSPNVPVQIRNVERQKPLCHFSPLPDSLMMKSNSCWEWMVAKWLPLQRHCFSASS